MSGEHSQISASRGFDRPFSGQKGGESKLSIEREIILFRLPRLKVR
jgi:hypothetical protein